MLQLVSIISVSDVQEPCTYHDETPLTNGTDSGAANADSGAIATGDRSATAPDYKERLEELEPPTVTCCWRPSRYQLLTAFHSGNGNIIGEVVPTCTYILVPTSWYQHRGTYMYQHLGIDILVPTSWYLHVPTSWYQHLGTNILVPKCTNILVPTCWYRQDRVCFIGRLFI